MGTYYTTNNEKQRIGPVTLIGEPVNSEELNSDPVTEPWVIGAFSNAFSSESLVDDCVIFSRGLTPSEIAELAASRNPFGETVDLVVPVIITCHQKRSDTSIGYL